MQADDWVPITEAPERVGRDRATIYRWLANPQISIRRMRPGRTLYLYLPDLLRVEAEAIRRRGRHAENRD